MGEIKETETETENLSPKQSMERGRGRTMAAPFPLENRSGKQGEVARQEENVSNSHQMWHQTVTSTCTLSFRNPVYDHAHRLKEGEELTRHVDFNQRHAGWAAFLTQQVQNKEQTPFLRQSGQFIQDATMSTPNIRVSKHMEGKDRMTQ